VKLTGKSALFSTRLRFKPSISSQMASIATVDIPATPLHSKRVPEAEAESPVTAAKKAKTTDETAPLKVAFDPSFGVAEKPAAAEAAEAPEIKDDEGGEDDAADNLLEELVKMFTEKNGRAPSEDEIKQWTEQIGELNAEGAFHAADNGEEEDGEDGSEDESDNDDESDA